MKKTILTWFCLACLMLVGKPVFAQKYNPAITVLLPENTTSDKAMRLMIDTMNTAIKERIVERAEEMQSETEAPLSTKKSFQNIAKSPEALNFHSVISVECAMALFEGFQKGLPKDSLLVYATSYKTTQQTDALKQIAEKEQVRYVIGFSELHYSKPEKEVKISMKAFLYDYQKSEILFHKEYNNEEKFNDKSQRKIDFQLIDGLRNVALQFGREVYQTVLPTIPNFENPQEIEQAQEAYLIKNIYEKEPNKEIQAIIQQNMEQIREELRIFSPEKDTLIHYYQGIFDDSKQKFLAFVWKEQKVSSSSEGNITQYEFDIVAGIYYKEKWYLDVATYPDSRGYDSFNTQKTDLETAKKLYVTNLTVYDFFIYNTIKPNPKFWEEGFFGKVQIDFSEEIKHCERMIQGYQKGRVTSNRPINTYLEVKQEKIRIREYKMLEQKNKPLEGMYEIVLMDSARRERKRLELAEMKDWERAKEYIDFEEIIEKSTKSKSLQKIEKIRTKIGAKVSIYTKNATKHIEPYILHDKKGKAKLHFFLLDSENGKVYEWKCLKPEELKPAPQDKELEWSENETVEMKKERWKRRNEEEAYRNYLEELIDKKIAQVIPDWLDGEFPIEDGKFWQTHVFKKKGNKYVYLVELLPVKK